MKTTTQRFLRKSLWGGLAALGAIAVANHFGAGGTAQGDPVRERVPFALPVNGAFHSFVVYEEYEGYSIMDAPRGDATLIGRTLPRASFPILEATSGPDCHRLWVRVAPGAWICGDYGDFHVAEPVEVTPVTRSPRNPQEMPWSFFYARRYHTHAYRTLTAATDESGAPSDFEDWEANWGFAAAYSRGVGDDRIVRSRGGLFFRRTDIVAASPSGFSGASFSELQGTDSGVPFGWVATSDAIAYHTPSDDGPGTTLERLARIRVFATQRDNAGHTWARVGPDRWVRAEKLRWIAPEPPPAEVNLSAGERWIDVDLASQTLIAYEGTEPVYATMVSTGRQSFATQPGVFRIYGRYVMSNMNNTLTAGLPNHYRLDDVPFVQFFDHGRALHGVYWHDHFGVARSHGCVNLAPRDAMYLFDFTAPALPPGWAGRELAPGEGTLVRVRGQYDFARDT